MWIQEAETRKQILNFEIITPMMVSMTWLWRFINEMAELFLKVCDEFNRKIVIEIGDLAQGVKKAKELEKQGIDVIISRGGTAIAIEKEIKEIPIVKVQVNAFDIIRAIHKIKKTTNKAAIIGFHPFTYGIEGLGRILNIEIRALTLEEDWYNDASYIKKNIKDVKEDNFEWLIGDNISVELAKELGMNSILIESGKEALANAIFEAERVAKIKKIELEKTKRFKTIVDFAYEGIITTDQNGIVDNFNPQAEKIFNKKAYQVNGEKINKIFSEENILELLKINQNIEGKIFTIGDTRIVANIIPIKINGEIVRYVISGTKNKKKTLP